jgi:hypothetical protein
MDSTVRKYFILADVIFIIVNMLWKFVRRMIKWVPCHHGMACPHAADGGDGLQIWSVAANILNKLSQTADGGRSSSLGELG